MEKTTLKITLKVFSIIAIVLGALAILGSIIEFDEGSGYGFIGGGLFVTEGWLALEYISRTTKKVEK